MKLNDREIETKPDTLSIKAFAFKSVKYWYLFVISLVIAYSIAYYKIRYSIPTYNVNARILIKNDGASTTDMGFMPGMELIRSRSKIVNEIGTIRSYPIIRKVLDQLPEYNVTYNDIGNIKTTELYKESPFSVEWDTLNNSLFNRTFFLKVVSPDKFLLSPQKIENDNGEEHSFGIPFNFGEDRVNIKLSKSYSTSLKEKLFSFRINNLDDLANSYLGNIGLNVEMKESSILIVSSTGTNKLKTIDFVNALIRVYINYGVEQANLTVTNTLDFVDQQLGNISDSLGISEQDMLVFNTELNNKRIPLVGANESYASNGSLISTILGLERDKITQQFTLNYYNYMLEYITKHDDANGVIVPTIIDGSTGSNSSGLNSHISRLIDLYAKKSSAAFSNTESSASFQLLLIEISSARQVLLENLKSAIEKMKFELQQTNLQLANNNDKLAQVPNASRELTNIKRKFDISSNLYTFLLQKRSEASIAKAASISKVQVLDWATKYRVSYIGTSSGSVYTTHIITGLAIAAAILLLFLLTNTRIIDKNDIEVITRIPIAGVIGHSEKGANNVVIDSPKSVISEAFRSVRTNISYMTAGKDKIVVVITSSVSGEGKTFCAINLASIYALSGKKTLLLGADLRQPKIYMDFGLENNIGMSNYLIHKASFEEVIQPTNLENLDIILSGPIPPNPAELLGSPATETLINLAKEKYEVVMIDTAPFGLVTDSLLLTSHADANLYVVRQFYTKRKQLHAINQHFVEGKTKNLAIVVNDLKQDKFGYGRYGYGYGYGYGGTYGYGYGYYSDDQNKTKKGFSWKSLFGIKS